MLKNYRVIWEIDIEAKSMKKAVRKARETQLDPDTWATYFEVENLDTGKTREIDLDD